MRYQPKRSAARWLEGAPEYILACYDNGGQTCDRYTVIVGGSLYDPRLADSRRAPCLCLSEHPAHPHGVSMWGEVFCGDRSAFGRHVTWLSLPERVRSHVVFRCEVEK